MRHIEPSIRQGCLIEPTGPHTVGLFRHGLYDENRPEIAFPDGRLIPVQIYFPKLIGAHIPKQKILETRGTKVFPLLDVDGYSEESDLDSIAPGKHPLLIFSHGLDAVMTDYAMLAEDLASHGYVVVSIQHQLETDPKPPAYWKGRSYSNHGLFVDNLLYAFEWLKREKSNTFKNHLNMTKIVLMGHSLGCNSLLLLSNVITNAFKQTPSVLLPHEEGVNKVKECLVLLDPKFMYPASIKQPTLFCLSEERQGDHKDIGTNGELDRSNKHIYKYYKGSRHISFLDHCWALKHIPGFPHETYFNGTEEECFNFWGELRLDIRRFLRENGV